DALPIYSIFYILRDFDGARGHCPPAYRICKSAVWNVSGRAGVCKYYQLYIIRFYFRFGGCCNFCYWWLYGAGHGKGRLSTQLCSSRYCNRINHWPAHSAKQYLNRLFSGEWWCFNCSVIYCGIFARPTADDRLDGVLWYLCEKSQLACW